MSKNEVSEVLNNSDAITIGQFLRLLKKLKITVVISLITVFGSLFSGVYVLGQASQQKDTAVMLQKPFSMRIETDNNKFEFRNLTLVKDPSLVSAVENTVILSLREIRSDFDIVPVGKVVAKMEHNKVSWPLNMFVKNIGNNAYAQDDQEFEWNGHNGDFEYSEEFITENTVNRLYSDDCLLEYMVNENRKSIPESFKWLRVEH